MKYSLIVPVFNRPDEVDELLESLTRQMLKDFVKTVPKGLIARPFIWFLLFMLAAYFVSGSAEKQRN